jgi:hypothetical protein
METVVIAIVLLLVLFIICVNSKRENLSHCDLRPYHCAYVNNAEPASVRLMNCHSKGLRVPSYAVDMKNHYYGDDMEIHL